MNTSFFNTTVLRALLVGLILVIIGFVAHTALSEENDVKEVTKSKSLAVHIPKSASTLPYSVSGIIESSNSVVIRAETAGVIQAVTVVEGNLVHEGKIVLSQDTSVLENQIALSKAQGQLSSLMQNSAVIQGVGAVETSDVLRGSASTSLVLTQIQKAASTDSVAKLLASQLQASLIELVAALDFIDTKRSYFPKASMQLYNETVSTLYGAQPTYLGNSVMYKVSSHDDIVNLLEILKNEKNIDAQKMLELSKLVDVEIATASTMFFNAEQDFFDETLVGVDGDIYTTYLNHRRALTQGATGLETAMDAVLSAQNNGALAVHGVGIEKTLSEINSRTTQDTYENTGAIYDQTSNVSNRQLDVLYAQKTLGSPVAPFTGVIAEVYIEEGDYVSPGTPLMKIVGNGARELEVRVPASMLPFLKEGLAFVVSGETKGFVSHFAHVLQEGSVVVFIELTDTDVVVGESLEGEILFDIDSSLLITIPRSHVFFNGNGAYVRTKSGSEVSVVIVHDLGEVLYVRSSSELVEELLPAVGIIF